MAYAQKLTKVRERLVMQALQDLQRSLCGTRGNGRGRLVTVARLAGVVVGGGTKRCSSTLRDMGVTVTGLTFPGDELPLEYEDADDVGEGGK